MGSAAYYVKLESLLLEAARANRKIRSFTTGKRESSQTGNESSGSEVN
jgi:hypothetical protein